KRVTPYPDIDALLTSLTERITSVLGDNLIGIYLTGSLSYKAFNPDKSDIDLVVILTNSPSSEQLRLLQEMHVQVGADYPKWFKRIECSYVPRDMLPNILPPQEPRPYIGEGIFYEKAPYGNEWLINQYLLYEQGIPLVGPDFKTLIKPIDVKDVQKACI